MKLSAFLISIVLLASIIVTAVPVRANPGVIKVPEDYSTIQAAIDAAQDGDLILVEPGEYAGAIVNKTVDIRGEEGETVINSGPRLFPAPSVVKYEVGFMFCDDDPLDAPICSFFGIFGTGSGSRISGFTFESDIVTDCSVGNLVFPIFSVGTDNVVVKNNVIHDAIMGITNWDGSNWVIKDNDILGSQIMTCPNDFGEVPQVGGVGIAITSIWGGPSNGNLIKGNRIIGAPQADFTTPAIALGSQKGEAGPEPTGGPVQNNRIVDNYIAWGGPSALGIVLLDGWGDDVVNNKIVNNEVHDSAGGIAVWGASSNTFTKNSIQDSQENGIYVNGSGNRFSKNEVIDSGVNGIFMDVGSIGNYAVANEVSGSGECDLKDLGTDNVWRANEYETSCP
ncbi:MAG: nitrous oxide reductase family maturation protein NosD [Candidatus Binatia bacterium]